MSTIYGDRDFTDEEASEEAVKLKEAMDGCGTNEEAIVEVLVNLNVKQRNYLADKYAASFGKPLLDELIYECTGDLEKTLVGMMMPPREYDAKLLHDAMKGAGTDEFTLVGILCTRNNSEIEEIKACYKSKYDRELQEDITDDVSGYLGRMLYSLAEGARDEDAGVDEDNAKEAAQKLVDAGAGQFGTDECDFNSVLCPNSYTQLREIFEQYKVLREGVTLQEDIESEMSSDLKDGYLAVLKITEDKAKYFAERLHNTMAGFGTDDDELIRLIISRSEEDLFWVKKAYEEVYGTSLYDAVASECSGYYKRCLLSLIQGKYVGPDA